eukprot:scaffold20.g7792.t1
MPRVVLEFSGGMELLFGNQKTVEADIPEPSGSGKLTVAEALVWARDHLLTERPELFMKEGSVRPGVLVLVNDVDWELTVRRRECREALEAQLQAAIEQIAALSVKVNRLEQALQQRANGSNGMSFLDRHAGLQMKRPASEGSRLATAAGRLSDLPPLSPGGKPQVPMAATRVVMTQLISPAESNGMNICMGGAVLSWIDICAGLAAKMLARGPAVTASVDAVHFLRPCHVGSVVILAAMVNRSFSSSMEASSEHRAYLTFVALSRKAADGDEPQKAVLPKVSPTSFQHFADIHRDAALRREARLRARRALRRRCGERPVSPTAPLACGAWRSMRWEGRRGGRMRAACLGSGAERQVLTRCRAVAAPAPAWRRQRLRDSPELAAQEAECRLTPITHREGQPTLPPALRMDAAALVLGGRRRIKPSLTGGGGGVCVCVWPARFAGLPVALRSLMLSCAPPVPRALPAAHMTQLIMPQHANSIGITFGGQVMRWMEQCAFISASRVCRGGHLLTAAMDGVAFSTPTRVGDIMYIEAQVTAVFGSSVEVMISVWGETPDIGDMFGCGDAYATIVSVDERTRPEDIPFELVPETRAEQLRYQAAVRERLAMREKLQRRSVARLSLDGARLHDDVEDALLHTMRAEGIGVDGASAGSTPRGADSPCEGGP